ncbi:hypothetical protein B0H67DRAFT_639334 [Lasiosphaeris hirsuta]|uniref:Uncharacterized protein n=1 Tax=Lasiosphaeris hirsuta TaxID=260670 RepID=A0AA40BAY7_9PEZI|nr:hypothetical protein B0H67DRAFT_639334 [Lasiosphaeris hirsuta]
MADEPEQVEYLAAVEHIPNFHSDLWELLHRNPDLLRRRGGLQLLGLAMRGTNTLDISSYPWVTETQILELIEKNSLAEHVLSIDLSNNTTVDIGSIRKILNACPNVTELSVLCVDSLSLVPLLDSVDGSNVRRLLHSELFRYPISRRNATAISGHFSSATNTRHIVKQAIAIRGRTGRTGIYGLSWCDQLARYYADASLEDLRIRGRRRLSSQCYVLSISPFPLQPLPGKLYQTREFPIVAKRWEGPCHEEIRPREWTVLVLATVERLERQVLPTVKHKFLTRNHEGHLVIADVKEFYRLTTQQEGCSDAKLAELEKQTRDLECYMYAAWSSAYGDRLLANEPGDVSKSCGEDEVMEIVSKVLHLRTSTN